MNLQPLADRVIIEPAPLQKVSGGGIIIPEAAQGRVPLRPGKIVAAGPLTEGLQTGNDVLFSSGAGTEVKQDGKKYLLMTEQEVWVLINN